MVGTLKNRTPWMLNFTDRLNEGLTCSLQPGSTLKLDYEISNNQSMNMASSAAQFKERAQFFVKACRVEDQIQVDESFLSISVNSTENSGVTSRVVTLMEMNELNGAISLKGGSISGREKVKVDYRFTEQKSNHTMMSLSSEDLESNGIDELMKKAKVVSNALKCTAEVKVK